MHTELKPAVVYFQTNSCNSSFGHKQVQMCSSPSPATMVIVFGCLHTWNNWFSSEVQMKTRQEILCHDTCLCKCEHLAYNNILCILCTFKIVVCSAADWQCLQGLSAENGIARTDIIIIPHSDWLHAGCKRIRILHKRLMRTNKIFSLYFSYVHNVCIDVTDTSRRPRGNGWP